MGFIITFVHGVFISKTSVLVKWRVFVHAKNMHNVAFIIFPRNGGARNNKLG